MIRGSTRVVGRSAEKLVLAHLRRRGLEPVERNYRTRRGEIDLIMLDGPCLVFVEVRYRSPGSFVSAVETVDRRKRRKLASAAAQFLSAHDEFRHHRCRFDVVGVDAGASGRVRIDWLRDAFRLDGGA